MKITRLQFESFRNLKDNFILPIDGINVIYGDNAQGKTNLLEAVWEFNGGHSFRTSKDTELIAFDKDFAKLTASFYSAGREQTAVLFIGKGKKEAVLNGVKKHSPSELVGTICSVVFSPEHLTLVKEGPSERRKFIDNALCQIKPRYMNLLNLYTQTLNQRNALLKEIYYKPELKDTLSIWNEHLAKLGGQIIYERLKYFDSLCESAKKYHDGLSKGKEELKMEYSFSFECKKTTNDAVISAFLLKAINAKEEEDLMYKSTSCGPHRDDIDIFINDKKAKTYASQGQQRSVVLSLKLAEAEVLMNHIGEKPVILLDDVLSELDSTRQSFLLNEIKNWQVFITCCELASVGRLKNGKIFSVKNGVVKKS